MGCSICKKDNISSGKQGKCNGEKDQVFQTESQNQSEQGQKSQNKNQNLNQNQNQHQQTNSETNNQQTTQVEGSKNSKQYCDLLPKQKELEMEITNYDQQNNIQKQQQDMVKIQQSKNQNHILEEQKDQNIQEQEQELYDEKKNVQQNDEVIYLQEDSIPKKNYEEKQNKDFEQIQENNQLEFMSFTFPLRTDKLSKFIELGRQRQRKIIKQININQNLINEIQELIFDKKLTVSKIYDLCQKYNIEMMKALFLYSNNQEIILQLILEYIEDYSIIEDIIINQQFPKNEQLIVIAQQLLKKLRPSVMINQVQMSINFLKKIKKTEQIQILIDSLKLQADINTEYQIDQAKSFISYFDFRKLDHVKLFGKIVKLFGRALDKDILDIYKEKKKSHIFDSIKIPKYFSKKPGNDFKIELDILNYNLFHEIAYKQNWQQFIQHSNPYYHQQSLDNRTPFWIFFQNAPIQIIVDYVKQYPNEFEQNIQIITNKGYTLIHCLCKNKNLQIDKDDMINQLISILDQNQYTNILLNIAYQDQIPLVYYLDYQKIYRSNIIEFLSKSLIKQFNFEKLEIEAYLISDQILNEQIQIIKRQPNFKQLSKKQKQHVKQQWILKKDENESQSEYLEFSQFYLHYIQLAKQIIKNNLFDQFPWISNYSIYSCHIPYDIGNVRTSLLYTLLAYQRFEQFNGQIQILCKLVQSFKYNEKQSSLEYSNLVQQISKLLFIYQELFNYSELQSSQILVANTISNIIKQNYQILLNKIYGLKKNEILVDNLFLQYLMKINMSCQEYIQFLVLKLACYKTQHYEIQMRTYLKSYGQYKTSVELLNQQIFAKDELIIKLTEINLEFGPQKKNVVDYEDILILLRQSLNLDVKTEVFFVQKKIILRSNSLIFQIMDQGFKLQTLFPDKFFNTKSLWLLLSYRNYNKQHISQHIQRQANQVAYIRSVNARQLEEIYDWQLRGMDCKFELSFYEQKINNSLQEQLILQQFKYNYEFSICLLFFDEFHDDMKIYFKQFPDKLKLITYNNFPLIQLLQNKSIKNLQFIIQELRFSKLELISILVRQYFCLNNFIVFQNQLQQGYTNFNDQMKLLLNIIQDNKDYERKNLMSTFYLQYFDISTIYLMEETLLSEYFDNHRLYKFLQQSQNEFRKNKIWTDEISIIILNIWFKNKTQVEIEQIDYLLNLRAFPIIDRWIVLNLAQFYVKFNLIHSKLYSFKFYNYAINYPDECWLPKLKIDFTYDFYVNLFLHAITSQNLSNKTRLMWFHNLVVQFGNKYGVLAIHYLNCWDGFFLDSQEILENGNNKHQIIQKIELINSNQVIKFSQIQQENVMLILDYKQAKNFIEEADLLEQDYLKFIQLFITYGLVEKLTLVFQKININQLLPNIIDKLIVIKQQFINSILEQKVFQSELINYLEFNTLQVFYGNQNVDYMNTFKYIQQQISNNNTNIILSQSDQDKNNLLDLLLYPNTTKILFDSQLVNILINIFTNRKFNNKSKRSIFDSQQFIIDRIDHYINLINKNIQNCEFSFKKLKYITEFQKRFFEPIFANICQLDQNYNLKIKVNYEEIATLIVRSQIKNENLNKILEKGINCIYHVNHTINFYLFKGADLAQQIQKGINNSFYQAKLKFLEQHLSISQYSLNLSEFNTEIFILKGLQELIIKKLQFEQKYLISSLLCNNIDTIIYVMQLHDNPIMLGFNQNIFQILIIYSNELNIIKYFDQFVYKKIKDNNRLFSLNNIPILYYIIQNRYSKVFYEVYLKQLQETQNEKEINNFISQQLLNSCPTCQNKIYQYALTQNCYFLFEYMTSFITSNDIKVYINKNDFEFQDRIKSYIIQTNFIQKVIKFQEQLDNFQKNRNKLQKIQYQNEIFLFFALKKNITYIEYQKFALYFTFEMKQDWLDFINNNYLCLLSFKNNQLNDYNKKYTNPTLLSIALNYSQDQNYLISNQQMKCIITDAQKHGLLTNQIYNQIIQKMPIEIITEIQIQNFNLQNVLAIAQSQNDILSKSKFFNFMQQQINIQKFDKICYINNSIYLIVLLLNLNNLDESQLNFIKIHNDCINKSLLIQSIEFLQQFNIPVKRPLSKNVKDQILQFTTNSISFEQDNEEIFWGMVQNNQIYYPILSEILTIKQIESLCHQLIRQMNYQFNIQIIEYNFIFLISFNDIDIQYNDECMIIPLEYDDKEIFISLKKLNQFLKHFKKILFQQNIDQEVLTFQNISDTYEKFELYSFLTDLDVENIPILIPNSKTFTENFFVFQDVMIQFDDLEGNYSLLDQDAPHQSDLAFIQEQKDQMLKQSSETKQPYFNNQKNLQLLLDCNILTQQEFEYVLSLLINDSKYSDEKQSNIYVEFYNFYNPKKTLVKFDQCTKIEFQKKANGQNSISFIIAEFYKYYQKIKSQIKNEDFKQWEITLPYYIDEYGVHFEKSLFSTYTIQLILKKLYEYTNYIQALFVNNINFGGVSLRINSISFLQVLVSNIINFHHFNKQGVDIILLLDQLLNWDQLQLFLLDLVCVNLQKQSKILSFIKRIYVEFNEVSEIPFENTFIQFGLDTQFRFGQTNYKLQQQNLIIQLNVLNMKTQLNSNKNVTFNYKNQSLNIFKIQTMDYYYYNIVNQEDMLFQIFNSNQLIEYLFQKFEIDRKFQQISKNLSNMLNKEITMSIHQQSLIEIFKEQIIDISQLKDRKKQLEKQFLIKYLLEKLSNIILDKIQNLLIEQLLSYEYEYKFQIMLSKLLHSLRQRFNIQELQIPNFRIVFSVEKAQVVTKFRYPNRNCDKLINLQYGFQLKKSYYLCQNKIGDVLLVCFKNNQLQIRTILCQLIEFQQGHFGFKIFNDDDVSILSEEQVQQYYLRQEKQNGRKQKNEQIEIVNFENLITIVYFTKNWPFDQDFINNILDVYITDQNGNLYLINEQRFSQKMIQIQETSSDTIRKQLLDQAFGRDQIPMGSSFAVSEIVPIFPQIIQIFFVGDQKVERKEEQTNFKYIDIKIKEQDFQIINLQFDNLNTASHFDTHIIAQQQFKQLMKFKDNHEEFARIQIITKFSDSLDEKASLYLDQFFQCGSSFEEFQRGYEEFLIDSFGLLIQNSLSIFFDVSEIEIKKLLFQKLIKILQFRFDLLTGEECKGVELKNGILQISSFIQIFNNGSINVIIPHQKEICSSIINYIIYDENLRNNFFIENQQYEIEIDINYEVQFTSKILSLLILVKYLYYLIILKDNRKFTFQITKDIMIADVYIYRIQKEKKQIELFYQNFRDLNIQDFLLDYLNGYTNQKIAEYDYFNYECLYQNAILTKSMNFKLTDFIKFQKQGNDYIELYISYNKKKLIKLEGWLDPRDFEGAFLLFKNQQQFLKIIFLKSCFNYSPLVQYIKQNSSVETICGQKYIVLVKGLIQYQSTQEQLQQILIVNKDDVQKPLTIYLSNSTTLRAKFKLIATSILLIEFTSDVAIEFTIKSQKFQFSAYKFDWHPYITLSIKSPNQRELQIGYHTKILYKNEQKVLQKEYKIVQNYFGNNGYSNLTINLIKKTLDQNENFNFKAFQHQNINLKSIQLNNYFNIQNKEDLKYSTKAGEERTDVIEFEDNFGNILKNINIESCVFIHSIYYQVQIQPKIIIDNLCLNLIWTPEIKGIYLLYINEQQIQEKLPFYQEISIEIQYRDQYYNIYGDLENSFNQVDLKIVSDPKQSILNETVSILKKNGIQLIKIKFIPKNSDLLIAEKINLIVKVNGKDWLKKLIYLEGQSFEYNLRSFYKSIHFDKDGSKIYKLINKITISRSNFLQCLLKLEKENLRTKIQIKFLKENGLDQGGLTKDFYFMTGNQMTQQKNGFFKLYSSNCYFFDEKFLNHPQNDSFAVVFGKVVANSILNENQIGIQLLPQFWKVVFEEQIQFKDLFGFLDYNTYQNYESLLSFDNKQIESLEQNFTYYDVNLIKHGDKVKVNKMNCQEFLDKTAQYLIKTKFQVLFTHFINGFSSVLDIKNLKCYFKPQDMGLITLGIQDIKPQQLLNAIEFKGGQDYHEKFFMSYVNQLNGKKIRELLQYITGSPTLPFNSQFKIFVEFEPDIQDNFRPTTQTCFNTIKLPLYKSYQEMKQKLDTAISYALVGFYNK